MRKITRLFFLFLICNVYSQNNCSEIKHKKKFVSITTLDSSNTDLYSDKILIDNDTLININENIDIQSVFSSDFFKDKKLVWQYKKQVFGSNNPTNNCLVLMQWVTPIVIYIDKALPKKITAEFTSFINQLQGIDNLHISITKNINKANYFIAVVDEEINSYSEEELEAYDATEREELTYKNLNYKLLTNKYSRIYGNKLKINKASIEKDKNTSGKIKKAFFTSLGQFQGSYRIGKDSFLDYKTYYIQEDHISAFDLKILKMHYHTIYDFVLNIKTFNSIEKAFENENNNTN